MPGSRLLTAFVLLLALAVPAGAAENLASRAQCLSKAEQRAAIAGGRAVPLVEAMKSLRSRGHRGELVRASLCHRGEGLVYVLTLLARNGRVLRAHVDAANGVVINIR